jgi:uncharacterized repeat protein (TIGR01451 family)
MSRTRFVSIIGCLAVSGATLVVLLVLLSTVPPNAASASEPVRPPQGPLAAAPGDVVVNEFAAKGSEWVELYNTTATTVNLGNWYVVDADCGSPASSIGPVDLGPGEYFVVDANDDGDNFNLDNSGDVVVLCDGSDAEIDHVSFGNTGAAPIAPSATGASQYSTARIVDGQDSDDDALDWNLDSTPTKGSANDVPGNNLGSSVLINEVDLFPTMGNDRLELYNPAPQPVTVTGWCLSDGDDVAVLTGTLVVPAEGFLLIEENVDWIPEGSTGVDFTSSDVAYLFDDSRVRHDQIGFDGHSYNNTAQRIPDGAGPNDGYDWASSGGDVTWFDVPETLGYSNDLGRTLEIRKAAPAQVNPGGLLTYTITVENVLGFTLDDVAITDIVPANATFAYALDGGGESGGVVTWSVASLSHLDSITVRFAVTATNSITTITNADYAVAAANFITPTAGAPVLTIVDHRMAIRHIQGAGHVSPLVGRDVEDVHGIVTALTSQGFYMQDPHPDSDIATSEAIYVYTGGDPMVTVGAEVLVSGTVAEYYPGGYDTGNLATSQLGNVTVVVSSTGNALPAPIVIGTGGRVPPHQVIDDDGNNTFDPTMDGIDFYESLEAMLIQVNDAVAVGPTSEYGEIPVVGDSGDNAAVLTPRRGIVIQPDDFNPERIIIDDAIVRDGPKVNVGASFTGPITGVLDYSFGSFKLLNTAPLPGTFGGVISETTTPPAIDQLRVASFNVENLDPKVETMSAPGDTDDDTARFIGLADQIVNNLHSPDIIALQEVQDNSGADDDGTVDATTTYISLTTAIQAAGGPAYDFRDIAPQDGQDGGQPGGNIRVGFLFRLDRVTFVDRGDATATDTVTVTTGASGVELSLSPGRIDPGNIAFNASRKSLAGEFLFNDHKIFVIANHFRSKGGDTPLFGRVQPPVLDSAVTRTLQAQVINDFVEGILALDPHANVVVLGDLNDFQFSEPISDVLAADVLINLVSTLPITEQYTYIYDGNSQVLDHVLVSDNLFENGYAGFDIVHTNAEFAYSSLRPSDHDPIVATFTLPHHVYLPLVMRQH